MICIIVACDDKRGIGKKGKIPWHFPEDLQIFRTRTTGNAVVMGRVTWESIPKKPLKDRLNVVITSSQEMKHPGAIFVNSYENAIKVCEEKKIFVIGGEMIYKKALESGMIDKILVTKVPGDFKCDRFFPNLDDKWKRDEVSVHVGFDIINYIKT